MNPQNHDAQRILNEMSNKMNALFKDQCEFKFIWKDNQQISVTYKEAKQSKTKTRHISIEKSKNFLTNFKKLKTKEEKEQAILHLFEDSSIQLKVDKITPINQPAKEDSTSETISQELLDNSTLSSLNKLAESIIKAPHEVEFSLLNSNQIKIKFSNQIKNKSHIQLLSVDKSKKIAKNFKKVKTVQEQHQFLINLIQSQPLYKQLSIRFTKPEKGLPVQQLETELNKILDSLIKNKDSEIRFNLSALLSLSLVLKDRENKIISIAINNEKTTKLLSEIKQASTKKEKQLIVSKLLCTCESLSKHSHFLKSIEISTVSNEVLSKAKNLLTEAETLAISEHVHPILNLVESFKNDKPFLFNAWELDIRKSNKQLISLKNLENAVKITETNNDKSLTLSTTFYKITLNSKSTESNLTLTSKTKIIAQLNLTYQTLLRHLPNLFSALNTFKFMEQFMHDLNQELSDLTKHLPYKHLMAEGDLLFLLPTLKDLQFDFQNEQFIAPSGETIRLSDTYSIYKSLLNHYEHLTYRLVNVYIPELIGTYKEFEVDACTYFLLDVIADLPKPSQNIVLITNILKGVERNSTWSKLDAFGVFKSLDKRDIQSLYLPLAKKGLIKLEPDSISLTTKGILSLKATPMPDKEQFIQAFQVKTLKDFINNLQNDFIKNNFLETLPTLNPLSVDEIPLLIDFIQHQFEIYKPFKDDFVDAISTLIPPQFKEVFELNMCLSQGDIQDVFAQICKKLN